MSARLTVLAVLSLLLAAPAWAGNNTYCVGARGECSSAAVVAKHSRWHAHTMVTDGKHCYECFDEVDNTCASNFLRNHPGWSTAGLARCAVLGMAPQDEGVVFHVIGGREIQPPRPKKPPPKKKVTLSGEVYRRSPGPYAVGDTVTFDVRVTAGGKETRPFSGGQLVVTNAAGQEIARVPVRVKGGSATTASAGIKVPAGDIVVRFEPADPSVRSTEQLAGLHTPGMALTVGSCPFRAGLGSTASVVIVGETLEVSGPVTAHTGGPAKASDLTGARVEILLQLDGGLEARFPGRIEGSTIKGTIKAPDIDGSAVTGTISVVGAGAPVICPGPPKPVTVSRAPFTLTATAPAQCWTGQECAATFTVGIGSGPGATRARELLSEPELEVIAKVGGDRVSFDGTAAGGTITVRTTPADEGRVTFSLELRTRSETAQADVQSDVAEAITLRLPEEMDLGSVSGGEVADTCVPLDFSASNGAMGARFAVALADPCADCEAELVSVAGGTVYQLPLDDLVIGKDEILQICLRVGRCPTGDDGGEQIVVVTPLEPQFAGQVKRVRIRYTVAGKSSFACWSSALYSVLGVLGLIVFLYGFRRPIPFPPGATILAANDIKKLSRAAPMLLEAQPYGKPGWYRDARVYVDGGGGATRRRGEALFLLVPAGGGVGIVGDGVQRRGRRSRTMEPVELAPGEDAVVMQRGREYQVGNLVLALG